ncbi:MAG: Trm112 family protein [Candidatus Methylopumilus sp.]
MDKNLLKILVCPVTKGSLIYKKDQNELISKSAKLAYPIRDGIPILLESEARMLKDNEDYS